MSARQVNNNEMSGYATGKRNRNLVPIMCIIATGALIWFLISISSGNKNNSEASPSTPLTATTEPASTSARQIETQLDRQSPQAVESQIRQFAAQEYPNDLSMQQYVYRKQIAAYRYMVAVQDLEVKQIAVREYPNDYSMQEYIYDKQLSAKRNMLSVEDSDVKQIALTEYPSDYSMQKYIYDKQISAKQYMNTQADSTAKSRAQREYPNDYSMQKYTYDRLLTGSRY
jgi:hypothetical protein